MTDTSNGPGPDVLVCDRGGLSRLAARSPTSLALIRALRAAELWPPVVPTVVLVESLRGHAGADARTNQFLKTCTTVTEVSVSHARRAARLRSEAGQGSAVDALVIALAEPGGTVLTGDRADLLALAAHAVEVSLEVV